MDGINKHQRSLASQSSSTGHASKMHEKAAGSKSKKLGRSALDTPLTSTPQTTEKDNNAISKRKRENTQNHDHQLPKRQKTHEIIKSGLISITSTPSNFSYVQRTQDGESRYDLKK